MINEQKGNMYGFVTHTWNAIKGACEHDCSYCYMKRWGTLNPIRLDMKEFKSDLGHGNFIFVGSSTDMFASNIKKDWIEKVLEHCNHYDNKYLFQTKNPARFKEFLHLFPEGSILCVTLESDITYNDEMGKSPRILSRVLEFADLDWNEDAKMITIEPIFDFNIESFVDNIKKINPFQVNIGADSGNNNLPEPSWDKIESLIKNLKKFTNVFEKDNLKRLHKRGSFKEDK